MHSKTELNISGYLRAKIGSFTSTHLTSIYREVKGGGRYLQYYEQ